MTGHTFTFNGISSIDLKIVVQKLPPRPIPQQRVTTYTVPGRSGTLHISDGSYESIVVSIDCVVTDTAKIPDICLAYQGSGKLTHDGIIGYYYNATVMNTSDIARMSSRWKAFQIQFECQPFQYHDSGDSEATYHFNGSSGLIEPGGNSFSNPGTLESLPKITINGSGTIRMTVNGLQHTFADVIGSITVDSENLIVYNGPTILNASMTAAGFPWYKPGANTETYQLVGQGQLVSIVRTPHWRSL